MRHALIALALGAAGAATVISTPQSSGVTVRLRGVVAVSDSAAWVSGANGTILRTSDAGATWQAQAIPGAEKLDFRDVDAIDERVAYALSIGPGEASCIYKTVDGGRSWQLSFKNDDPKAFLDAMAFWNAQRGVAVSDSVDGRFVILLTSDGGKTWTRAPALGLPPALPNEGAFAASGTNVAVFGTSHVWIGTGASSAARVLRSKDGGRTWAVSTTPLPAGPSAGIFSIAFRDESHGIVVGGDYKKEGEAVANAVTDDGGVTWQLAAGFPGFRSAVAYVPGVAPPALLAVGPTGADLSTDDGRTFSRIESPGFHALSVSPKGGAAWAVGEGGRVARLQGWSRR